MPDDLKTMRNAGVDPYTSGFRVGAARQYRRSKPETWVNNEGEIKKLLLLAFPNLATQKTQRQRAARWTQAIYLCLRLGYTYKQAAKEMNTTMNAIRMIIRSVRKARKGLTRHGIQRKRRS